MQNKMHFETMKIIVNIKESKSYELKFESKYNMNMTKDRYCTPIVLCVILWTLKCY